MRLNNWWCKLICVNSSYAEVSLNVSNASDANTWIPFRYRLWSSNRSLASLIQLFIECTQSRHNYSCNYTCKHRTETANNLPYWRQSIALSSESFWNHIASNRCVNAVHKVHIYSHSGLAVERQICMTTLISEGGLGHMSRSRRSGAWHQLCKVNLIYLFIYLFINPHQELHMRNN